MGVETIGTSAVFYEPHGVHEFLVPMSVGSAGVALARCPVKQAANEDVAAIVPVGPNAAVLAVADGLGGHAGGDTAAQAAIERLVDSVEGASVADADDPPLREAVMRGFDEANRAVLALGIGAGCTMAAAEIVGRRLRTYHVGDAQVVAAGQRGKVRLVTIPHSPVGYGVEAGLIEEADALHHAERHLVSNMVGSDEMRIDVGPLVELAARDTVVLASDGLFDNLRVDEVVQIVRAGPLKGVVTGLCDAALGRMSDPVEGLPSKPDDLVFVVFRPGG